MDQKLLDKFFKGQCSERELREVTAWYASGKADSELSEKIETYWNEQSGKGNLLWRRDDVFRRISEKIKQEQDNSGDVRTNKRNWWPVTMKVAAVIVLLLASFIYLIPGLQRSSREPIRNVVPEDILAERQTYKGEKLTITLGDGSVIRLNGDSRIRYQESFVHSGSREVFLEGEAFFEVARDSLRPFVVRSGGVITTVLGTSFNINAYPESEAVDVSVVSGSVNVHAPASVDSPTLILRPDEQGHYSHSNSVLIKRKFEYPEAVSWKDGTLFFKGASFIDAVKVLERWYGVTIDIRKEGIEDGFSGSYTNKSLKSVLNGMSFVLEFEYTIDGKTVIIY